MKKTLAILIFIVVLVCFFSIAFAKDSIEGTYKYKNDSGYGTLEIIKSGDMYKVDITTFSSGPMMSDCGFEGEGSFDGTTLNAYDTNRYDEKVLLSIKIDGRQAIVPEADGFCGVGAYLGGTFTKE